MERGGERKEKQKRITGRCETKGRIRKRTKVRKKKKTINKN
jgi:hypothetical protein